MMTMIKRVETITGEVEALRDKINYFIENELTEKEYVSDVKIIENGRSEQTRESYLVGGERGHIKQFFIQRLFMWVR